MSKRKLSSVDRKWTTLQHNGPHFCAPYERKDLTAIYKNEEINLSDGQEEMLLLFVEQQKLHLEPSKLIAAPQPTNFWDFFKKSLSGRNETNHVTNPSEIDYSDFVKYARGEHQRKSLLTREEKAIQRKNYKEVLEPFQKCFIDGDEFDVINADTLPGRLFKGRGRHPLAGCYIPSITPEEVIINCTDVSNPPLPPTDHKWKNVVSDSSVSWLWNYEQAGKTCYSFPSLDPMKTKRPILNSNRMSITNAHPGWTKLDEEIEQLRALWSTRNLNDCIAELQKTHREMRKFETDLVIERRNSDAAKKEFQRLKEIEKKYRELACEKKYTNRLADVNSSLRSSVLGQGDESTINRVHDEIDIRDEKIKHLENEVHQLRHLQKHVLHASGNGQTGRLLAAQYHTDHLEKRVSDLTSLNNVLHNEVMGAFNKQMKPPNASFHSDISKHLCTRCKPRTVLWYDDLIKSWHSMHHELQRLQSAHSHSEGSLINTAAPPTPLSDLGGRDGQILRRPEHLTAPPPNIPPITSRVMSPPSRSGAKSPTTPFGFRSLRA